MKKVMFFFPLRKKKEENLLFLGKYQNISSRVENISNFTRASRS